MEASPQWYMAIGGHKVGPVTEAEIHANLQNGSIDAETLVFAGGMANWTPLKLVPQFQSYFGGAPSGPVGVPTIPGRTAHDIEFDIKGAEMQYSRWSSIRARRSSPRRRTDVHDVPGSRWTRSSATARRPRSRGRDGGPAQRGQARADRGEPCS